MCWFSACALVRVRFGARARAARRRGVCWCWSVWWPTSKPGTACAGFLRGSAGAWRSWRGRLPSGLRSCGFLGCGGGLLWRRGLLAAVPGLCWSPARVFWCACALGGAGLPLRHAGGGLARVGVCGGSRQTRRGCVVFCVALPGPFRSWRGATRSRRASCFRL